MYCSVLFPGPHVLVISVMSSHVMPRQVNIVSCCVVLSVYLFVCVCLLVCWVRLCYVNCVVLCCIILICSSFFSVFHIMFCSLVPCCEMFRSIPFRILSLHFPPHQCILHFLASCSVLRIAELLFWSTVDVPWVRLLESHNRKPCIQNTTLLMSR